MIRGTCYGMIKQMTKEEKDRSILWFYAVEQGDVKAVSMMLSAQKDGAPAVDV